MIVIMYYLFCTITAGAANLAPGFQKPIAGADAEKSRLRVFFLCVCVCVLCVLCVYTVVLNLK